MRIDRAHSRWLASTLAATAALVALYAAGGGLGPRGIAAGSIAGLALGVLGLLLFLIASALGVRKLAPTLRIGPLHAWLRAHLWLGLLSLPVALLHAGFHAGGPLTSALLWLLALVVGTGIVGSALQHVLPRVLLDALPHEATFASLERRLENLRLKALDLVERIAGEVEAGPLLARRERFWAAQETWTARSRDREREEQDPIAEAGWTDSNYFGVKDPSLRRANAAPGKAPRPDKREQELARWREAAGIRDEEAAALRRLYLTRVLPYLERPARPEGEGALLVDREEAALVFGTARAELPDLRWAIDQLEACCDTARVRVRQRRLHWLLHGWLVVHVPLAMILLVLTVAHAWFALQY